MVWKVESGVGVVDKLESPSSLIDIIGKYSYQSAKKRFLGWESAITVRQRSHQVSCKFVSRLGMGKDGLSARKRMIVLKLMRGVCNIVNALPQRRQYWLDEPIRP
jgi:hypothetical protein